LLLFTVLITGTLFYSCTSNESRSENTRNQSIQEVEIFIATPTSVINEIYTTGTILADEQV